MQYQAIARNLKGEILSNEPVSLKVSLITQNGQTNTSYYSETQDITTNQFGLFTLVIGGGNVVSGSFSAVPWSTENVWLQVEIKDKGQSNYTTISNSKLLTVPYAFHAETANTLVGPGLGIANGLPPGVPVPVCACEAGLSSMNLLYLGSNGVTVNVYKDQNLKPDQLLQTFSSVQNGATITLSAVPRDHKLQDNLFLQIAGSSAPVIQISAKCEDAIVGQTYGNFSVVSRTDVKNGVTCSVCDVQQNWKIGGNVVASPCNWLGSMSNSDIILITNNIPRATITAAGDINVNNNLSVGKTLTVTGSTTLQNTLDVTNATHLKSTLTTDGVTNLNNTLGVTGITSITNSTQSTTPGNGALVVTGGVGIGGNLNVAGSTNFGSVGTNTLTARSLNIINDTSSYLATFQNTNTGDGDGIKIKLGRIHPLWNGTAFENVAADDFNPLYGAFTPQINTIHGWLSTGNVSITPADFISLLKSTGEFLGGALCQLTNALTPWINSNLGLPLDISTPINNGIGLPLDISTPINHGIGLPYDFTTPINNGLGLPIKFPETTVFPGFHLGLPPGIPDINIDAVTIGGFQIVPSLPSVSIPAIPAFSIPKIPAFSIPAIPQINCSGLPTLGTPNIRSSDVTLSLSNKNEFIRFTDKDDRVLGSIKAESINDFNAQHLSATYLFHVVATVGGVDIARGLLRLAGELNTIGHDYNNLGVQYISGNGDYAEWMERTSFDEMITPGDIVGVKGGKITKDLKGAEQIMAVSSQPVVSANMPNKEKISSGNSIAFMGQIPVKIIGAVTTGDFIVARGDIPGYGVAVPPSQMTAEDYRLVVGRAWETINTDGPKMVNTLVGVQNNDFLKIIQKYQQKLATAEDRLDAIEKKLEMHSPNKKITKRK